MSRSTAKSKETCSIRLKFENKKGDLVHLTITSSYKGKPIGLDPDKRMPEYVVENSLENIRFVSSKECLDDYLPIEIYSGNDPQISPILLLEETTYDLLLTGHVESEFDFLTSNNTSVSLVKNQLGSKNEESLYRLLFKSYVGKGIFDVKINGEIISIPFEVRSKKINYITEYPVMLNDIAKFSTSLLLQQTSPLYTNLTISKSNDKTFYEDFLILEHLFFNMGLIEAYEQVKNNKNYRTTPTRNIIPTELSGHIDPADLFEMIRPDNLIEMDSGPIAGRFIPRDLIERSNIEDYDTPENRLVKDLILTVQRMIYSLIQESNTSTSDFIKNKLNEMRSSIDTISYDTWLKDVGDLEYVPYNSTVLQYKSGYSELFSMYQIVDLGAMFKQNEIRDLLKGHNIQLHRVYEYWCYTRLYRSLFKLSTNKPPFPWKRENKKWTLTIKSRKSISFEIKINNTILDVDLHYNKTFDLKHKKFMSYSLPLKPDFSIIVSNRSFSDRKFVINFDAKYKTKPKINLNYTNDELLYTDCWEFDVYKMHTYRDALIHSWGSYVLFPGKKEALYIKPIELLDTDISWKFKIPSVGAIPLIPGSDKDEQLDNKLSEILKDIANISYDEWTIDKNI